MLFNSPNDSDPAAASSAHSSPSDQQPTANPFEIARPYTNGHGQVSDIGAYLDLARHKTWLREAFGVENLPPRVVARIFTPRKSDHDHNYELHEFLGDAVLDTAVKLSVVTARNISQAHHSAASCANLTSNEFLADRANQLGFYFDMVMLPGNSPHGSKARTKITANIVEATIGAVHSLLGFEAAFRAVQKFVGKKNFITQKEVIPNMSVHPNGSGAFNELPVAPLFERSRSQLERLQWKIGHPFKNLQLLYHGVFRNEERSDEISPMHRKLQVIGGSILFLASTDCLHSIGLVRHEHDFTLKRKTMLSGREVASLADEIGIVEARQSTPGGLKFCEPNSQDRREELLKAVIGAIYVDAGYRAVTHLMVLPLINWVHNHDETRDPRTDDSARRNGLTF